MVKKSRKKQKISSAPQDQREQRPEVLGSAISVTDEASKDDDERRLESSLFDSSLFWTSSIPRGKDWECVLTIDDDDNDETRDVDAEYAVRELRHVTNKDLFYFDTGTPTSPKPDSNPPVEDQEIPDVVDSDGSDDSDHITPQPSSSKTNNAAWTDPDDANLNVSLTTSNRLRKFRDAPDEDVVGGREYERRLRRQFERINPTPEWALKAQKKARPKRTRGSVSGEDEESDQDRVGNMFSSTDGILATSTKTKNTSLPQRILAIERLRDGNQSAPCEGEVKVVRFHPSPQIPVLLTAGSDRRVRLFNIDGLTNPHLQTLHIPALPMTSASFNPSGSTILLTGPRPFYYTHDLQSGTTHRSPRGLWGTTFNDANPAAQDGSMEICSFSPNGEVLAVAGRGGYVHLVDWKAGSGQVVGSVKMNKPVKDVWWARGAGADEGLLMSLSDDSMVYVWNVAQRRCVRRWQDEGGFGSRIMSGDRAGKYVAIGNNTGLVNVYGSDASISSGDKPKPLKTIGNLTTLISTLRFNHDSQLLAIASNDRKDQMRMIHLPSLTAFANWPTASTPLGRVTTIDFSTGSEYVAIGNNRGRVLMYHLRDFGIS